MSKRGKHPRAMLCLTMEKAPEIIACACTAQAEALPSASHGPMKIRGQPSDKSFMSSVIFLPPEDCFLMVVSLQPSLRTDL